MKAYEFVAEVHEDFGELGWRLASMYDFDPLGGMAVAHDCLEHLPGTDASVEAELMALGASLYVRGEGGYAYHNEHPIGYHLSGEVESLWEHTVEAGGLGTAPPSRPLRSWAEEQIDLCLRHAAARRPELLEWAREGRGKREPEELWEHFLGTWRGWMRLGYRRARRRFAQFPSAYDAQWLFRQIERMADEALKAAHEGDRLRVHWQRTEVFVVLHNWYREDDWEVTRLE